jgi:hypothetical protein
MSLEAFAPLLAKLGFKKRGGFLFTLNMAPGVVGWLGLNYATEHYGPGEFAVFPVVGVRFEEVEKIVDACSGAKKTYLTPTISSPLVYLMPEREHHAWVSTPATSAAVAAQVVEAVATYGIPFMRTVPDLAALCRYFQQAPGREHDREYRRPAAALVAGDLEQARALIDAETAALGARTDAAALHFRKFADAFRGKLAPH